MEDKTKSTTTIINSDVAGGDAADRLSSLPEHLISDILSELPIVSAVATSILSRHWRHQWTYITRFHLTCYNIPNCDELFYILTTVDNILKKLANNLRTFSLQLRLPDLDTDELEESNAYELCYEFLPHWFQRICSSHTEQFEVIQFGYYLHVYIQDAPLVSICSRQIESYAVVDTLSLPECIFENKTLVELVLSTNNISFKLPHYLNLPNLNKLSLQLYEFDRQLMRTIFKSLPLVKDLDITAILNGHDHFIDISAPNLKIFAIVFKGGHSQTNVLIDAPKLKRISVTILDGGLVLFRFVKIPIDLLKTRLSHRGSVGDELAILELVKAIRCTRSLGLCCPVLNVLNSFNVDELPTFHNLVDVTLSLSDQVENMNLAIPVWILRRIKTIKVHGLVTEYDKEISLMEYFLSKANVLERLICFFFPNVEEPEMDSLQKENDFVNALFMLPRVSSCCEIEFIGLSRRSSTNLVEEDHSLSKDCNRLSYSSGCMLFSNA